MLSNFLNFILNLKATKSQKAKQQLIANNSEFKTTLEFYMFPKNSPAIKQLTITATSEETKAEDVHISKLLKL
jgi:hypothetical protein